jgi:hypothetical protein
MGSATEDGVVADGGEVSGAPDNVNVPNEIKIVRQVKAKGHSDGTAWDLIGDTNGPYGGGEFTEAVVSALPGESEVWGWGHISKNLRPGGEQYNGHAVDAIAYKSPAKADGTSELYNGKWFQVIDIVLSVGSGRAGDGVPHWHAQGAPVGNTPDSDLPANGPWYRP